MMREDDSNNTVTQPTGERMNTMNAQPQGNSHDSEISDMAEEMSGIMQAAFDLLIQRRDERYAAAIEPLDTERDTLEQESTSIQEARVNLELLLPAKAREAQRAADALLVAGNHQEATAKLSEAQDAANAPAAMAARQREISVRLDRPRKENHRRPHLRAVVRRLPIHHPGSRTRSLCDPVERGGRRDDRV